MSFTNMETAAPDIVRGSLFLLRCGANKYRL